MNSKVLWICLTSFIIASPISGGSWSLTPVKHQKTQEVQGVYSPVRAVSDTDPEPAPKFREPRASLRETYESAMGLIILKAEVNYPEMYDGIIWETEDDIEFHNDAIEMKPGYILASAKTPGKKRIRFLAAIDNRPAKSNWCVITVFGPQPPPAPTPNPTPKPVPDPTIVTSSSFYVIIFDDFTKRSLPISKLIEDPTLKTDIEAMGHKLKRFDLASDEAKPFLAYTSKVQGASVIFLDIATKKVLNWTPASEFTLPTNKDALMALVKKYTKS